jgi:uncharacterized protein with PIN domain
MLGKLAKWLRVMGHDVLYKRRYSQEEIEVSVLEGRILLTRNSALAKRGFPLIFIRSDRTEDQLKELSLSLDIAGDPYGRFSRCIECNEPLVDCLGPHASGAIPEFVAHTMAGKIKRCLKCGRYFWPGSHRARMEEKLRSLGLCWFSLDEKRGKDDKQDA